MGKEFNSWVVAAVRPPLLLVKFVAVKIYDLLFARLDKKLAKRSECEFGDQIRSDLSFLFSDLGGKIVPNEGIRFPPPFDYAVVSVEVDSVQIRFFRGRGELSVRVAKKTSPPEWYDLKSVLSLLNVQDSELPSAGYSLVDVARVLKPNFGLIRQLFSDGQYDDTRSQLSKAGAYDRAVTRQWQNEINRRLYE